MKLEVWSKSVRPLLLSASFFVFCFSSVLAFGQNKNSDSTKTIECGLLGQSFVDLFLNPEIKLDVTRTKNNFRFDWLVEREMIDPIYQKLEYMANLRFGLVSQRVMHRLRGQLPESLKCPALGKEFDKFLYTDGIELLVHKTRLGISMTIDPESYHRIAIIERFVADLGLLRTQYKQHAVVGFAH